MSHVVMFSGGVGSWAAGKRVAEAHGTDDLLLCFADTLIEDEDLYRFLAEAAQNVGGQFVRLADGRTPWQVFEDVRFIGNSRIDPCSRVLKRDLIRSWLDKRLADGIEDHIYLGIDWTEEHRLERARGFWHPYDVSAPMCDAPRLEKSEMLDWLRSEGIAVPRLYGMGFAHNNCGGFCVKGGHASFRLLLKHFPARYLEHEEQEERMRRLLGKDVAIMRDRTGGTVRPLTMREFREKNGQSEIDDGHGGCGCFSPYVPVGEAAEKDGEP